jgi:AraC-like DNA-binding protein
MNRGDLVAELSAHAMAEGANAGLWPGLTIYRFTGPAEPRREGRKAISIGIVADGLVICDCPNLRCQASGASPDQPCVCLVLEVDPRVVCQVSASMPGRDASVRVIDHDSRECVVSALDDELTSSVLRFLRSLSVASDRRVLAPLYLQEMVYRVLQRDECDRLARVAAQQISGNPVRPALDYIAAHLADPLTITELAKQVSLSPSAFSRLFREVTGHSPYQFVKERRLCRARELLDEGRLGVAEVSRSVGYASCSHFIKGFRGQFGFTPGDYLDAHPVNRFRQVRGIRHALARP